MKVFGISNSPSGFSVGKLRADMADLDRDEKADFALGETVMPCLWSASGFATLSSSGLRDGKRGPVS